MRGTLVTASRGHVWFGWRGVQVTPVDLPLLHGSTEPVRLPTVIAGGDVRVSAESDAQLSGVLAAWGDFEIGAARPYDDKNSAKYHWKNWNEPLYLPHADDDGGLRWDLLEWTDSPQKPPQDQE